MGAIDIFSATQRPEESLFYSRGDPLDVRMGERVRRRPQEYSSARWVLFGCPQDEGVERNAGRIGARHAPTEIRRAFYRLPWDRPGGFDLGDLVLGRTLEETHDLQTAVVESLLADGKIVLSLGGGNDVAYADGRAASRKFPRLLAFNIDAHLDVRAADRPTSGTPYRQLLEEGLIAHDRFFEIGIQPLVNSASYLEYARRKGISIATLDVIQGLGVDAVLGKALETDSDAIFWGFDMDSVRASDAPGVSAPTPTGLSAEDICRMAAIAGRDRRTRVVEVSEVNPLHDTDGRTSRLAALVLLNVLAGML